MKVTALITISTGLIVLALFVLSVRHEGEFLDLVFEVTSAFGTVGLSMGATGRLDEFGRWVVMAVMLLGRVGPLTSRLFPRDAGAHSGTRGCVLRLGSRIAGAGIARGAGRPGAGRDRRPVRRPARRGRQAPSSSAPVTGRREGRGGTSRG